MDVYVFRPINETYEEVDVDYVIVAGKDVKDARRKLGVTVKDNSCHSWALQSIQSGAVVRGIVGPSVENILE